MKKSISIITAVVVLTLSGLALAQLKDKGKGIMENNPGMIGTGMMDGKMKETHSKMKSMMDRSIIATSDGGVVVVMGNKLMKYDKDLNFIKEVELKMDMAGMEKMKEHMKGKCPMMGDTDSDQGSKMDATGSEQESGHDGHH